MATKVIANDSLPLVSIGMPVYNAERYVEEAIQSILGQTFANFELIISDNASTDATPEICQKYAAQDNRIRLVSNEFNLGAAKNYNHVFLMSRGRYFRWAAADDLCAPEYLERCVEVLENDRGVILAYPKTKIIDQDGTVIDTYDDGLHLKSKSASGRFLQFMYNVGECNAVFGVIRSDGLIKTHLIGSYIGSDVCLLADLSLRGRFFEIPEALFFRRHHPKASSAQKDVASQQQFFDPASKGRIVLPLWRHFFEHCKSIRRADIPVTQKILPMMYLLGGLAASAKKYVHELRIAARLGRRRLFKKSRLTGEQFLDRSIIRTGL